MKPVILCFVAYYLPGYRSGGPVRTIANFVEYFGDEFDIRIVTRDRDALDTEPYIGIAIDAWNTVGNAQVFYASDKTINLRTIAKLLHETPHDVLYLNSFFAFGFTGLPLIARRFGIAPRKPCVIALRGEFSSGAIALKAVKKRTYICLAKALGLYRNLYWQASSDFEKTDICRELESLAQLIHVVPNLTPIVAINPNVATNRTPGPLRLIFLSRISPKKNLDFLLRALSKVSTDVELAIYGPPENAQYWSECQELIKQLPTSITVKHKGELTHEEVPTTFMKHDVFFFPTRGENFGHVIFEALAAGTCVVLSNQTPWKQDKNGAVEIIPLNDIDAWIAALERWTQYSDEELNIQRNAALQYAHEYITTSPALEKNRQLFLSALTQATPRPTSTK